MKWLNRHRIGLPSRVRSSIIASSRAGLLLHLHYCSLNLSRGTLCARHDMRDGYSSGPQEGATRAAAPIPNCPYGLLTRRIRRRFCDSRASSNKRDFVFRTRNSGEEAHCCSATPWSDCRNQFELHNPFCISNSFIQITSTSYHAPNSAKGLQRFRNVARSLLLTSNLVL